MGFTDKKEKKIVTSYGPRGDSYIMDILSKIIDTQFISVDFSFAHDSIFKGFSSKPINRDESKKKAC